MFADYKSSSSEAEDNKGITTIQKVEIRAEIPVESNKIPQIDDDGSDVLAQFYDEIEQVEFSFKSQSDQQTFESVQENFVEEKTVVENTTLKEASSLLNPVTAVPDSLAVAVEKIDEVDNVEPQTTTQKIFKILHSKKLISKKMFDYTAPCLSELQSKIEKWTELKNEGLTFNNRLENTHAFRNPSIMSKMISFLELDPYASNMRKVWESLIRRKFTTQII